MTGLLGTSAPLVSDLVALVEVAMAVLLLAGAFVVRTGRVRFHKYLQSAIVLVNLPIVLVWMVPRFVADILPGLPGEIAEPYYLVPTLMLVVGAAAQALGLYILLVAGTNLVPARLRFRRYKLWMRTELLLWWSVVGLGLATYFVWYASTVAAS